MSTRWISGAMRAGLALVALWVGAVTGGLARADVRYVDGGVSGGTGDGSSWANAHTNVAAALAAALPGDDVWLARGTYNATLPLQLKRDVTLYGGFTTNMEFRNERDWGAHPVVLAGAGTHRILVGATNAVLDGLVVSNGYFAGSGGGLLVDRCPMTLRNCIFVNNRAAGGTGRGGALAVTSAGSSLSISNCLFRDNAATDGGAAYWNGGAVTLRDSSFTRNTASSDGGAAYAQAFTGLVENCVFSGNTAAAVGGALWSYSRAACTAVFRGCVFTDNRATGGGGACGNSQAYTFEACVFSGNRATSYGGAIGGIDDGSAYLRCIFAGNESGNASYGGAAVYHHTATALPVLENCLLAGNVAAGPGGALYALSSAGFALRHCTLAGNRSAKAGGAIACGNGAVQVVASVLWSNSAAIGGAEISETTPGTASVLYSDVRGGPSGTGNFNVDPLYAAGPEGEWTASPVYDATRGQTALTDTNHPWADGLLAGQLLHPSANQHLQFAIASNAAGIVYVWGNAALNRTNGIVAVAGSAYRVASLQPREGSPLLEAGGDFGVTNDIRGLPRPQPLGGTNDVGAYEGPAAVAVAFHVAASFVGEQVGTTRVSVVLDNLLYGATGTVEFAVTGGTAVAGVDYVLDPGSLSFDAYRGRAEIPVTILDNAGADELRTIVMVLTSPTNLTLGAPSIHTLTLLDDDAPVTVAFASAAAAGFETAGSVALPVTLSRRSPLPVTVRFDVAGGTAAAEADYRLTPGVIEFPTGTTNREVVVELLDDALVEGPETVLLALSEPSGATLGAPDALTLTILDDDLVLVDGAATGAANGTSWENAYPGLAQALEGAATPKAFWVAEGTYRPAAPGAATTNRFHIRVAHRLYGGFRSGMTHEAQRDPWRYPCVLSGDLNGNDAPNWGNRSDNVANVVVVDGAHGAVLDGFTVRGGDGPNNGAGLYAADSDPLLIARCTFTDNRTTAAGLGAGMWCNLGAFATVRNGLFYNNASASRAGALGVDGFVHPFAHVEMINCTITGNDAPEEGDGVYARASAHSVLSLKNCILWGNDPQNIRSRGDNTNAIVYTSYCDYDRDQCSPSLPDNTSLTDLGGTIEAEPLFADPAGGDFHLKSKAGRWTPGGIVFDSVTSPCIDAGDPADDCGDEPQAAPCRLDMGAFGGTAHASGSAGALPRPGMILMVR